MNPSHNSPPLCACPLSLSIIGQLVPVAFVLPNKELINPRISQKKTHWPCIAGFHPSCSSHVCCTQLSTHSNSSSWLMVAARSPSGLTPRVLARLIWRRMISAALAPTQICHMRIALSTTILQKASILPFLGLLLTRSVSLLNYLYWLTRDLHSTDNHQPKGSNGTSRSTLWAKLYPSRQ